MKIFDDGYQAFKKGLYYEDNPYSELHEPEEYEEWADGWYDGSRQFIDAALWYLEQNYNNSG